MQFFLFMLIFNQPLFDILHSTGALSHFNAQGKKTQLVLDNSKAAEIYDGQAKVKAHKYLKR